MIDDTTARIAQIIVDSITAALPDGANLDSVIPVWTFLLGDALAQASDGQFDEDCLARCVALLRAAYEYCCTSDTITLN